MESRTVTGPRELVGFSVRWCFPLGGAAPAAAPMVHNIAMIWGARPRKSLLPRGKMACGVCGQKLLLLISRETYTCKGCKKTLPRRFAAPRAPRQNA